MTKSDKSFEERPLAQKDLFRAREALELLAPLIGNQLDAKCDLIDRAGEGQISIYARYYWTSKEKIEGRFAEARRGRSLVERKKVSRKALKKTPDLLEDAKKWDWRKGKFYLKRMGARGRIKCYRVLDGVWFKKSEIQLLVSALEKAIKIRGDKGRPTEIARWTEFNVALFDFATNPSLFDSYLNDQEAFTSRFHRYYSENFPEPTPLSENTVKLRLHAIYNHLNDKKREQYKPLS